MLALSKFLVPQDGIRHEEPNTTVYFNDREVGKGILYITESLLYWVNHDTHQGFSLKYPHISLHAISRDEDVYPRQCLYIMVDAKDPAVPLPSASDSDSENEFEDADTPITEMRFAPDDINSLDAMFQAMNECQAMHPDPQDNFSDAEEDIYEDAEEIDLEPSLMPPYILSTGGMILAGQFEDAEEDM